jgi:choice-of-anchor C domain-containing protein
MGHDHNLRGRGLYWSSGAIAFVLLVGTLWAGGAAGAVIVNGSFEEGPALTRPTVGFDSYTAPFTGITGWSVTGQGIDYVFGFWDASNGQRSLDLNNIAPSGVEQTFSAVPGGTYRVTFDMAGNSEGTPTLKRLRVSADGESAEFTFDAAGKSPRNMGWESRTWQFVAGAPTVTLSFMSLIDGGFGPALDNVNVELVDGGPAVPLPPAFVAGAIAGGAVLSRRRRAHLR